MAKEMNIRDNQAIEIALNDKDILIKKLEEQGISKKLLDELTTQLQYQ